MAEVSARLKNAKISPQKARLVADLVRGNNIANALEVLTFSPQKAAFLVKKVVVSAVANAEHNLGIDIDDLKISKIYVDQGRTTKRLHTRARGRSDRILKRSCHITVTVSDN